MSVLRGGLSLVPGKPARALPCAGPLGAVPEQVLDTEVAPQLPAQDGDDGGDPGGGEARLTEEEDEPGYQLCLVGHTSTPGPFPASQERGGESLDWNEPNLLCFC